MQDYGQGQSFEEAAQQYVNAHREQHENGYDAVRLLKLANRAEGRGVAGSVLYSSGDDPPVVAWSINPYIAGAGRFGAATAPANAAAGDLTVDGILSVATNAAPATGVKAQVTGAAVVSKWLRAGSLVALTGATTDGDIVGKRVFIEDANFNAAIAAGVAAVTFDANDALGYTRSSNTLSLTIGSTVVMVVTAAAFKHAGYASFLGATTDPSNTTAGDLSALRGHFGPDNVFSAGKELEVVGDALISQTLEVGDDARVVGYLSTRGLSAPANTTNGDANFIRANVGSDSALPAGKEFQVAGDAIVTGELELDGALNHDGPTVGFYGTAPVTKPIVTGSRGGNAAVTSLLTALAGMGLITDSTS